MPGSLLDPPAFLASDSDFLGAWDRLAPWMLARGDLDRFAHSQLALLCQLGVRYRLSARHGWSDAAELRDAARRLAADWYLLPKHRVVAGAIGPDGLDADLARVFGWEEMRVS